MLGYFIFTYCFTSKMKHGWRIPYASGAFSVKIMNDTRKKYDFQFHNYFYAERVRENRVIKRSC